jgi:hypothetical protein
LLQAAGIARHRPHPRIEGRLRPHAPRVRGRPNGGNGVLDHQGQIHRQYVQPQLARDDPRDVQDVVDDLGEPGGVTFQGGERVICLGPREQSAVQQSGTADHRIQRRAQFVRQHGQELVLQTVGFLRFEEQTRVLEPTDAHAATPTARRSCSAVKTSRPE